VDAASRQQIEPKRETLGSSEFLNDHTYHPSIPNLCHCVTERTGIALSIEVWRHIIHQPPEFPQLIEWLALSAATSEYWNYNAMSAVVSKRLTNQQKDDFDDFVNQDPRNWESHIEELLSKASSGYVQIKGLSN
jgi:hypothetical protein